MVLPGPVMTIFSKAILTTYQYSSILTCLVGLPMVGAFLLMLLPAKRTRLIRNGALAVLAGMLAIAIAAACLFNWRAVPGFSAMLQLQENLPWIRNINAHFHLAVNALSLFLILLVCGAGLLAALTGYVIDQQIKTYYVMLLLLAGMLVGALASVDLLLFYLFSTAAIFPGYFLLGLWGGPGRRAAAMKFGLFGILGSIALLLAIIAIGWCTRHSPAFPRGTLNMVYLTGTAATHRLADLGAHSGVPAAGFVARAAFWLLLFSFAARLGVPGLHMWLPDVVSEASVPALMLTVGGNLVLGAYGLARITFPMFPRLSAHNQIALGVWAACAILYGALCALAQSDLRKVTAYWLLSQAGYILLASLIGVAAAFNGAILFIAGDLVTLLLLLWSTQTLERRANHRDLNRLGGMAQLLPDFFCFSIIGFLCAMACPSLCLFPALVLTMVGIFSAAYRGHLPAVPGLGGLEPAQWFVMFALAAAAGAVLIAANMLWTIERIFLGQPRPEYHHFTGLTLVEKGIFIILIAAALAFGIIPDMLVLAPIHQALQSLVLVSTRPR